MMESEINKFDALYKQQKEGIIEFKGKIVQCQADKIEIMRDLATYEVNFATNPMNKKQETLRSNLSGLLNMVLDARVKIG